MRLRNHGRSLGPDSSVAAAGVLRPVMTCRENKPSILVSW